MSAVIRRLIDIKFLVIFFNKHPYEETALFAAVKNKHEAVVALLLASKAKTEYKHNKKGTPLCLAAEIGYEAAV